VSFLPAREEITMNGRPPTSFASPERIPPVSASASIRVRVKVSDPARGPELRDYFQRLGLCAFAANDGSVEAECLPGSGLQPSRDELDGYINQWVKTNRIAVQFV
jgi:hypothetical protein